VNYWVENAGHSLNFYFGKRKNFAKHRFNIGQDYNISSHFKFCNIPKNASTFVRDIVMPHHSNLHEDFCFTILRNPWERFMSAFAYGVKGGWNSYNFGHTIDQIGNALQNNKNVNADLLLHFIPQHEFLRHFPHRIQHWFNQKDLSKFIEVCGSKLNIRIANDQINQTNYTSEFLDRYNNWLFHNKDWVNEFLLKDILIYNNRFTQADNGH